MIDASVFLAAVLPTQGPYIAASIADGKTWQRSADSVQELIGQSNKWLAKGRDCYFLVASVSDGHLKSGVRAQKNIAGLRALRVDLDVGEGKTYTTRQEVEAAIISAVNKKYLPKPWVVNSGGGYHCYWPLQETLNPVAWEALAKRFLSYLRNSCGIAVDDPACTTDTARILRMPGTTNYKLTNNPRLVEVVQQGEPALATARWSSVMDLAGTPHVPLGKPRAQNESKQLKSQLQRDLDSALEIPVDPNLVFQNCQQLRHCRENTATISEPLWYAALGATVFISEEAVLAVSQGHPDYTPDEALRKAEQWRSAATGPTTCAKFFSLNPAGCAGCTYATTVTSPIQLGKSFTRIVPIHEAAKPVVESPADTALASEQTLTPTESRIKATALLLQRGIDTAAKLKLRISQDGVWGTKKDPESGEMVPIRLWGPLPVVLLAAQEIDGQYNLAIAYKINMDVGSFDVKIVRSGLLVGNSAQKEWAENFLVTAHPLAGEYLVNWAVLVSREPACEVVGRYGFTDETNTRFVMGDTVYTAEGESVALVRGNFTSAGRLPNYRVGSLEPWIMAAGAYAPRGAEPFAVTVLSAFASPLVKLVHEHTPAAIFLEGATGGGKTTAVRVAASVWAHYEEFEQGGSSTPSGLRLLAAKLNVLPLFVDETRSGDTRMARNFLYDMSNGSGRVTGTPGQNMITRDPFTLITVVTSNSPASTYFFDGDRPINRNTDAGISARVLPLRVDTTIARAADAHMPYLSNISLARNYGLAGAQYIRWVLNHEAQVESMFRQTHHAVKLTLAAAGLGGSGERAAVTIAAIHTAGIITNKLGLTSYNMDALRSYMVQSFTDWISERVVEYSAATDIIVRFFEEHHRSASIILPSGLMATTAALAPMVIYQGHAYFMQRLLIGSAGRFGLTTKEAEQQIESRGFQLVETPFTQGLKYYRGPAGLYVANTEPINRQEKEKS